MERMFIRRRMLFVCFLAVAPLLVCVPPALGQPKAKLRPLRIALPSNTIAATHFYVGRSLGIFENHGFSLPLKSLPVSNNCGARYSPVIPPRRR